jgi:S-formylglutathione hydrolase FrmB
VDGGERSYWHDRKGASWARYLLHELLPAALQRTGGDPRRVVIEGISMGAYSALDLARLHPGRFCGVAAHSPILWNRWRAAQQAQPGGFDDRRDFLRHDVLRAAEQHPRTFAGQPTWLDVGVGDDLAGPGTRALASALRRRGVRLDLHTGWPGGHGGVYWGAHWDEYLRFDAAALRACPR